MATTNGVNGVNGANGHLPAQITAQEFSQQEFDYLICGGGTAGLCIAARLTEDPNVTVGVIDAGKNKLGDMLVDTPALFIQMLGNPEYDWNYKTVPQSHNKDLVHHIPRGKVVGGSSGINYMMYVRGSLQDYDDWAEITNDPSWAASEMKHYMRKHQTLEPISEKVIDRTAFPFVGENHGTSGPVRTSFNDNALPLENEVILAADAVCGFSKKPVDPWYKQILAKYTDFIRPASSAGDHIGFFNTLGSVARSGPNKGKRSYAARGFFEANASRPNLKLIDESTVARVVLENGTAVGAEYINGGQKYSVKAKREVIVCGGTIASPQILELSGIGDRKILEAAGVECLVDNPAVGTDFQDHQLIITSHKLADGVLSADCIYRPEVMQAAQKQLIEEQAGPLTNISCVQGFFPVKLFLEPGELEEVIKLIDETPTQSDFHRKQLAQVVEQLKSDKSANLQFVFVPATAGPDGVSDQAKLWPSPADPLNDPNGVTLAVCLQYCASRGSIHITSSDPFQHPRIDPGYLSHPADTILLSAAYKFADKLAKAPELKGAIKSRFHPPPEVDLSDPKKRREQVKEWMLGEYHVCGSCAMGHTVDSRLRVYGAKNLRVADASTFANNVSGNIVSSVYAVAEKAADMIKEDWKGK